jgi:hypothetical protein
MNRHLYQRQKLYCQQQQQQRTLYTVLPTAAAASDIIYETPKKSVDTSETEEEEEERESDISQEHVQRYGEIASPYITPYQTNKPYLDRVFGI